MNTTTTAIAPALLSRIEAATAEANRIIREHTLRNYPNLKPETVTVEFISDKWAKMIRCGENGGGRSVYGFIALADYETKGLGKVKAGDIHKSEGWKKPAKHARGSVFAEDFNKCMGPYGIQYLR